MKSQIIRMGIAVILAEILILNALTGQVSLIGSVVVGLFLVFLQSMLIFTERVLKRSTSLNLETLDGWKKTIALGKKSVGLVATQEQVLKAQQMYIIELEIALQRAGLPWPGGREGLREVLRQANAKVRAN